MKSKLKNLKQIDGKLKDKKEKCAHNSYSKIEEDDIKSYKCNDCEHTWS